MKQVKLRKVNKYKYCLRCGYDVEVVMIGQDGFCPNETHPKTGTYLNKLYSVENGSKKEDKHGTRNR